jgi:hypothetical protein
VAAVCERGFSKTSAMRRRVWLTAQSTVTGVSPGWSSHAPAVNQICSPSADTSFNRTSSTRSGCQKVRHQLDTLREERQEEQNARMVSSC